MNHQLEAGFGVALHIVTIGLEAVGVCVIVFGALFALVRSYTLSRSGRSDVGIYHLYRQTLGRAILLGLELLVAADIIGTVAVEPTLQNVLILAVIVLIRTFLSISLTVEIEGRWPWQQQTEPMVEKAGRVIATQAPGSGQTSP